MRGNRREQRPNLAHRRCEQYEVGVREFPRPGFVARKAAINDAAPLCGVEIRPAAPDADYDARRARALERERERASDKSHPEHDELADPGDRHRWSAEASAATKRSISSGRPTVTRRCSGKP